MMQSNCTEKLYMTPRQEAQILSLTGGQDLYEDILITIRNAASYGHSEVYLPYDEANPYIINALMKDGFYIDDFDDGYYTISW